MKLHINDKDVELRWSFRSLLLFENIMQKSFEPKGLTDIITYMYCVIIASDKDLNLTYDDFLFYLDEHPNVITDFSVWLQAAVEKNNSLMLNKVSEADKKKAGRIKKSAKN